MKYILQTVTNAVLITLISVHSVLAGDYGESKVIVAAPKDPRYHHLSWPKVVKAKDGSVVVAYIAGRKHVNGDGCPAISRSVDGGKTFTPPKVLMNFDSSMPYQHCANLAMGVAEDGAIVLMGMAFTKNERNNIYGWRSEDNGISWERTDTSALGENRTGSVFGHLFNVHGKGLAVCGHYRKPKGDGLWIAFSGDNGKSWNTARQICKDKYYEPTFIYADNQLIGLIRENDAKAYHQYVSDDLGESWKFTPKVIQGNSSAVHPSPFIVQDSVQPERVFSLQTERTAKKEVYLWQAQRDTLDWQRCGLVVSCPKAADFGYPWMTHLSGDKWFVVYYAGEKDGPNSIYGMKITIPRSEKKDAAKAKSVNKQCKPQAGVLLTFDDCFIEQWERQLPLFEKYDASATFFITRFHTLSKHQIAMLKEIQSAGHAIGCHSVMHRKAVDYVRDHGIEDYLRDEINPSVKLLRQSGFQPTSFAYPSSSHNAETDAALSKIFRHERSGIGVPKNKRIRDLNSIFVPVNKVADTRCLIGTGIDYSGTEKRPDYPMQIKEALDRALKQNEIVVFYAHNISEKGPGHHLKPLVLEEILAYSKKIGLPTLTYDDLP